MFESYLVAGVVLAVFYLVYVLYYDDYQDFFKFQDLKWEDLVIGIRLKERKNR